jgi:hypothetical protein
MIRKIKLKEKLIKIYFQIFKKKTKILDSDGIRIYSYKKNYA